MYTYATLNNNNICDGTMQVSIPIPTDEKLILLPSSNNPYVGMIYENGVWKDNPNKVETIVDEEVEISDELTELESQIEQIGKMYENLVRICESFKNKENNK